VDAVTGEISWTQMVFYHLYGSAPMQLRRTVLNLKDGKPGTITARQTQLDGIVSGGVLNGAVTKVLLPSVLNYAIITKDQELDGYAATVQLANIRLGVATLTPGAHTFTFRMVGKNPASSGYTLALDTLSVGAAEATLEGEHYAATATASGASAPLFQSMNTSAGWSNVAQLLFQADSSGDSMSFPFYFNTWLESTFSSPTASFSSLRPAYSSGAGETVLQLVGNKTCWDPGTQTGDTTGKASEDLSNKTIRVVVSGANLVSQGQRARVTFTSAPSDAIAISSAYIMRCQSGNNGVPGTACQLTFSEATGGSGAWAYNSNASVVMASGVTVQSDYADLVIDPTKDYLITYHVAAGRATVWDPADSSRPPATTPVNSWELTESGSDSSSSANWDSLAGVNASPLIPAVSSVYAAYAASGDFLSQVFDTQADSPTFRELLWRTYPAGSNLITVSVRAAATADAVLGQGWTAYSGSNAAKTLALTGRYVQFKVAMAAVYPYTSAPVLRDVRLTWDGAGTQAVDIAATIAKGPDRGKFQFLVDGSKPPVAGAHFEFTQYQDYLKERFTNTLSVDLEPRNP